MAKNIPSSLLNASLKWAALDRSMAHDCTLAPPTDTVHHASCVDCPEQAWMNISLPVYCKLAQIKKKST